MSDPVPPTNTPTAEGKARTVLAKFSFAEEFAKRQRHRKGWVKAAAGLLFVLVVIPAVWAIFSRSWVVRLGWIIPAGLGLVLLRMLMLFSKGSYRCPQCREDITNCTAVYCHGCGQVLEARLCKRCGVDRTWTAAFDAMPLRDPILYCPGCGVYLNSPFYRGERDSD